MNANELNWFQGVFRADTSSPVERLEGELVYTVYLSDLLKMPDVNFSDVAAVDTFVQALLN